MEDLAILNYGGAIYTLRWFHYLSGVCWIGLLYYFNFVHGAFMAEADAGAKPSVVQKLLPRALGWFRWAAVGTFLTGIAILGLRGSFEGHAIFMTPWSAAIMTGAVMAIVMFLNVWLVIWPNQQVVIASSKAVSAGQAADPKAAACAAKALLASRTNCMLSIPMLFFMGAGRHLAFNMAETSNLTCYLLVMLAMVLAIAFNGIKGKLGPIATIKGVIHCGLALTVVFYAVLEMIL